MLFDTYYSKVIPNFNRELENPNKNYSEVLDIIAPHSEVPRSEYNYVMNSDGLRSIEFDPMPEVIALGCSITLGQGLPVDLRWSDLLSKRIDKPIGNISYSGAAINKDISSFFGLVNQYGKCPKILLCNFANFERFYFIDEGGQYLRDWYINYSPKVTKAKVPWNYQEILPYEWVYYQNLDHIKMLEVFCDSVGIKLLWTCWSNALTVEMESFLTCNFKHYVPNMVRKVFPENFEFNVVANTVDDLEKSYKMKNWDIVRCHKEYKDMYPEIFEYAYDKNKIAGPWGSGSHWPHPGLHKQLHFADFFYEELKDRSWI